MPIFKIRIAILISVAFFVTPLILGGFFISANTVQAQITSTVSSTQVGGNWSNPTTWADGEVPIATDGVEINGPVYVDINISIAQVIVSDQGILQNYRNPYGAYFYTLTVDGEIVNNGTIQNNYYGFFLNVAGNITNNGTWNNYRTYLITNQSRQIITANPIESEVVFDQSFEIIGSPSFYDLDFNDQTITLNSSEQAITILETIKLPGTIVGQGSLVFADNSSVAGDVIAPTVIFAPGNQKIGATITADQIIFKGPGQKNFINTTLNGSVNIEQGTIVQNYRNPYGAYFYTLTIDGEIVNNGTIQSNYYGFFLNVAGNITNNGTWNNYQTYLIWDEVAGATDYQLRLSSDNDIWLEPIILSQAKYNITDILTQVFYWQTRANVNGNYTGWSETRWINGTDESELEPVILIPGIIASYLNRDDQDKDEIWLNLDKMLISKSDDYLDVLKLKEDGYPDAEIFASDIIRKILFKEYWQGLIEELESEGYIEDVSLFVFPYDWRLDIDWIAGDPPVPEVANLENEIGLILAQTGAQKVNIIAHSMGGLVAKRYMVKYGSQSVNKFIDIATPHIGAPKAFKILEYGDDMGLHVGKISLLNSDRINQISQNFPSIYQLLPSRQYFTQGDSDLGSYIADVYDLDNNQLKGNLNFDQSIEFMRNTGRNDLLLGFNDNLHNTIDSYTPQFDGIDTYNIIGCGQATLGKIYVLNKEKTGEYEYGLKYINGDSTVPLGSAEAMFSSQKAYLKNIAHAEMPSADGVKELIISILQNEQENFNFSGYSDLNQDNGICSFNGTQVSLHSPMTLHVYDESGNHLGPDENGDIEYGIPGAEYDVIDGNTFVFLPDGLNYTVKGEAESQGQFNARIQDIEEGEYTQTVYYNQIPIETESTNIGIELDSYIMRIDQDGDQVFEDQLEPDSILDQEESADTIRPETTIDISGDKNEDDKYITDVEIELIAEDDQGGSGVLITEYSFDNQIWHEYLEPIILDEDGNYVFYYMTTDRAGNVEEVKQLEFVISRPIAIDDLIGKIRQFYIDGKITKKHVKNSLIRQLQRIQKQINLHEKKLAKREKQLELKMEKCLKKKDQAYCDRRVEKVFNRKTERLKQIRQRFIQIQYSLILKQLKHYDRRNWIDDEVYGIIKSDIEYLKTN